MMKEGLDLVRADIVILLFVVVLDVEEKEEGDGRLKVCEMSRTLPHKQTSDSQHVHLITTNRFPSSQTLHGDMKVVITGQTC